MVYLIAQLRAATAVPARCSGRTWSAARTCRPPAPFILASNHLSFIDSMAIPLMAPRKVGLPGQGRVLHDPRHRGLADQDAVHRAGRPAGRPRQTHRAAQEALDTAMTVLDAGGGFGIYPEGTRSRDGRLARGKTGVAWLALTADCPVVPVGITGTDRIQPVGASWPRPQPLHRSLRQAAHLPRAPRQGRQQPGPPRGDRHGSWRRSPSSPARRRPAGRRGQPRAEQRPDVVGPRRRAARRRWPRRCSGRRSTAARPRGS